MKQVIYVLTLAIIIALVISPAVLAENEPAAGVKGDGTGTVQSNEPVGTEAEEPSLLESIVDAVEDLLGKDDPNLDPPIGDVHPPDWNDPTGDDGGWEDEWK